MLHIYKYAWLSAPGILSVLPGVMQLTDSSSEWLTGKSVFFYFDPNIIVTRIPFPQYAEQWYKQEYPGPGQGV